MTTILIADACKPSLVMTSEVFKDKIPGAIVYVADTGASALSLVAEVKPDMCVVDFDLPDVDGPALVEAMRKVYSGPILMTAYPDDMVKQAVQDNLFACNDASAWVAKPVQFDELSQQIDRFLVDGHRLGKRFETQPMVTQLVGKAAGRGKRAPKVAGRVINLSLGGMCVKLEGSLKVKKAQEFTLTLNLPGMGEPKKAAAKPSKAAAPKKAPRKGAKGSEVLAAQVDDTTETKLKAKVAWISPDGQVGLQFDKLTDLQKKGIESFLKHNSL